MYVFLSSHKHFENRNWVCFHQQYLYQLGKFQALSGNSVCTDIPLSYIVQHKQKHPIYQFLVNSKAISSFRSFSHHIILAASYRNRIYHYRNKCHSKMYVWTSPWKSGICWILLRRYYTEMLCWKITATLSQQVRIFFLYDCQYHVFLS